MGRCKWSSLWSEGPSSGVNYVRLFALYILETQESASAESFRQVLGRYVPGAGEDLMTYAQQLIAEGREEGRQEGRVEARVTMVENLLQEGVEWSMIERVAGVNEAQFEALKQQLDD